MPIRFIDKNNPITFIIGTEIDRKSGEKIPGSIVKITPLSVAEKSAIAVHCKDFRQGVSGVDVKAVQNALAPYIVSITDADGMERTSITAADLDAFDDLDLFWELVTKVINRNSVSETLEKN